MKINKKEAGVGSFKKHPIVGWVTNWLSSRLLKQFKYEKTWD